VNAISAIRRRAGLIAPSALLVAVLTAATTGGAPAAAVAAATPRTASNAAGSSASSRPYVPGEVVVGYAAPGPRITKALIMRAGVRATLAAPAPSVRVLRLAPGVSVGSAIARLRGRPGVAYAVPNYLAHADGVYIPDDRGRSHVRGGWQALQWNFLAGVGVNAPQAWANLIAAKRPGGSGVTVAILDTGIAYRNWRQYRESPDFTGTRFVAPYDFVSNNRFPLDREGHGTFVAGTVAEATNNGVGLTGLAYGASIMPVRVLAADGTGDAATISAGIRYAAQHGAQVINLSLEFSLDVSSGDIPDIISAIRFAHDRGSVVVAAAGNEGVEQLAYPARAAPAISVGATTRDRCIAYYSNEGSGLDLVAPGGGTDASAPDPNCHPGRPLPTIYQMTFTSAYDPRHFGLLDGIYGTSMSAPHVAAAAALVIASGVVGRHPTPEQVLNRLEQTAQHLGGPWPNRSYGYGLVDAGAATNPIASPAGRSRR
jgi:serine protease